MSWKVGELAKRTGVTVRTLHHYEAVGLVSPSQRTESGHRLYGERDVARLQQVLALRQLGLSLDRIREVLDRPGHSPARVMRMQVERLRAQITLQQRLCLRLEAIAARLESRRRVSVEELMEAIEETHMLDRVSKYYTPEQLEELRTRGQALGEEGMQQAETDWQDLIAEFRAEMDKGTDPGSETVQALARRWKALIDAFTGGNPEIAASLKRMYEQEPDIAADKGYNHDPAMMAYVEKAMKAAGISFG